MFVQYNLKQITDMFLKIVIFLVAIIIVISIIMMIVNSMRLSKQNLPCEWSSIKYIGFVPIPWCKYTLTNKKIIEQKGILRTKETETYLWLLTDVNMSESILERIVNRGSVTLYTRDDSDKVIYIHGVKNPRAIKEKFSDKIRLAKDNRQDVVVR